MSQHYAGLAMDMDFIDETKVYAFYIAYPFRLLKLFRCNLSLLIISV